MGTVGLFLMTLHARVSATIVRRTVCAITLPSAALVRRCWFCQSVSKAAFRSSAPVRQ